MTRKLLLVLLIALFIKATPYAQTGFERIYERDEVATYMHFKAATATADSDIVCSLYDNDQCILVRVDSEGDLEWAKTYNTPSILSTDGGHSLIETNDGGIVTVGLHHVGGYGKIFIMKTNALGDVLWTKGYEALSTGGEDVVEDEDGNLYVLASGACSGGTFLVLKLESDGDLIWSKTFMSPGGHGWDLDFCSDGNLVLCGYLVDAGVFSPAIAKITTDGTLLFGYTYPQTGIQFSMAHQVTELSNGNLVFSGYAAVSQHSSASLYVAMTDPNGEMLWRKKIDEPGPIDGQGTARGIVELKDGNILLTAETPDYSNNIDRLFLVMDTLGNLIKANVSKVPEFSLANNHKIVQTPAGGIYSVCSTSGLILRKIPALHAMCDDSLVTPTLTDMEIEKMNYALTINSNITTISFNPVASVQPITNNLVCETELSIEQNTEEYPVSIYPNPSSGPISIHSSGGEIFIYDLRGALVLTYTLQPGVTTIDLDIKPDLYLWRLTSGSLTHSGKILIR